MNFVRKSCPVNSRLWSRRIEYQMIEAGFLTFPALRGLPDYVSGVRSQAFPIVISERDYRTGIVPDLHRIPSHHLQKAGGSP